MKNNLGDETSMIIFLTQLVPIWQDRDDYKRVTSNTFKNKQL
jgi:hypothetical protein